ncbi:MAG: hypothetical protein BroJett033_5970 [Chloroflexota bacterium]|nr:MAG: hypothetical protein BroJett033_5970 [Chloroflexota bacterium]
MLSSDFLTQPTHPIAKDAEGLGLAQTHLPALYTPPADFFRQQIRATPAVNSDYWSFMLGGLVATPVMLSYADLLACPPAEQACALACSGGKTSGPLIANARWTGVPLRVLLAEARAASAARHAHLHAADGYVTSVPLEWAQGALLAYHMNGAPVPPDHGGPVRFIVPGLYGYKMPKWIQRVVLAEAPLPGPWEQRGWPAVGVVQTMSAVLTPRHLEAVSGPVRLSGVAYAGSRAITRVEVSIENGPWMPAAHVAGPPGAWTRWQAVWTPPAPGDYRLSVRATDETGETQSDADAVRAGGAAAAHTIVMRVSG